MKIVDGQAIARTSASVTGSFTRIDLRLLATADLHAHLAPWDELAGKPAPNRGLALVAGLVAQARAEQPQALLFDNGDFLNGSPLGDHLADDRSWRSDPEGHPVVAAMNAIGYDAATLGNHEFSHGLRHLRRALRGARFPVVTSNSGWQQGTQVRQLYPRQLLLRRMLTDRDGRDHAVTIGLIGLLPPQTAAWERGQTGGRLRVDDILTAAERRLRRLKRAGADLVIALAHSGPGDGTPRPGGENLALALARVPGIDVVIAGHTHQHLASPTVPDTDSKRSAAFVMPGFFGSHLGIVDLVLAPADDGWKVVGQIAALRPVSHRSGPAGELSALVSPCPAILRLAERETAAMRANFDRVIGQSRVELHSHFALIGRCPIQSLLAEAQIAHMASLLRDTEHEGRPILAAVAPFKAGGRGGPENYTAIPAGVLTARHMADLYLHPNRAVGLLLTGQQIALWLERAVSLFRQIGPGTQDSLLTDPDFPAYNFDMIHGLTYSVDLSKPARFDAGGHDLATGARICDLRHEGRPVHPDSRFVLASNSYRVTGGAGFAGTDPAQVVAEGKAMLRRVVEHHVRRKGTIAPEDRAGWKFVAMPGTSVVFDSAPEALPRAASAGVEPVSAQPDGFMRFRLWL